MAFFRFIAAIWRGLVYHWRQGSVFATMTQAEDRLAVCEKCPYLSGQDDGATCRLCNCFVGAKVMLKSESCPDIPQRWKAL